MQQYAAAKSLQSCPTLCDPTDGSPPGSPVPGILQARTLECAAISFSNAWKWKVKGSRPVVSDSQRLHGLQPTRPLHPWDFPGQSPGVGCHRLLSCHCNSITVSKYFYTAFFHPLCISKAQWFNHLPCDFVSCYFKSWKMMLWKCCTQYVSKFGKLSSGHRTGKGQFSFQSQRKAMPKNAQTTTRSHSSHMLVK